MSLKEEFLALLESDVEFRYAVAGKLGFLELLRRLDSIEAELKALREDFNKLHEEQVKLREDFNRHGVEEAKRFKSFEDEMRKLREDLKSMSKELSDVKTRLTRVERTLEELTLDVEEEARSFIKHRAREKLGVDVEVKQLVLPDLELNIYAAAGDLCILGEATVRAGLSTLRDLLDKLDELKARYPAVLRPRVVLVIYTSLPTPDLVEEARSLGVWLLKATEDYTEPKPSTL